MASAAVETSGLGVGIEIDEDLSNDAVWAVLELKIQNPHLFLPVCDVVARPSDDGKGA